MAVFFGQTVDLHLDCEAASGYDAAFTFFPSTDSWAYVLPDATRYWSGSHSFGLYLGRTSYFTATLGASRSSFSGAFAFYSEPLADVGSAPLLLRANASGGNHTFSVRQGRDASNNRVLQIQNSGYTATAQLTISDASWYWVAYRFVSGVLTLRLYDATHAQIGSDITVTSTVTSVATLYLGLPDIVSAYAGWVWLDDFVADYTNAAFPLLGWQGASTITAIGIESAETFGSASVSADIGCAGIASGEAVGPPSLSAQIVAAGISSVEAVGSPQIAAQLEAAGIPSTEAFGLPVVGGAGIQGAGGIVSSEALGSPALSASMGLAGIASLEAFGLPVIGLYSSGTLQTVNAGAFRIATDSPIAFSLDAPLEFGVTDPALAFCEED